MQNQRLKMPNTCKPCHFKIIWPVNWDYSSGQLVPRISDCKLNGFVWRMIPSEGISTALNIQSACPTPHQNSLLLVLCKAQAASLAAAPDARWYLEFPEAYTVSWQGNAAWWRPSTVPPAPSCHILNACAPWQGPKSIHPEELLGSSYSKLLQCVLTKSLSLLGLKENIAGQNETLSNRHTLAQKHTKTSEVNGVCSPIYHIFQQKHWKSQGSQRKTESHSILSISKVGQLVFWGPTLTKLAPSSIAATLIRCVLSSPMTRFCLIRIWIQLWYSTSGLAPRFLLWPPGLVDRWGSQVQEWKKKKKMYIYIIYIWIWR